MRRGPKPTHGHGTAARARRHYRDGEKPCPACRDAANFERTWNKRNRKVAS